MTRSRRSFPIRRSLELLIEVPAVVLTFAMMAHITVNAILRTWWDQPINHTLEVVEYWYLPLIVFLGFIAAQHRGQHISTDLIFEMLPGVTRRFVLAFILLTCAVVSLGFAWFGWQEALHAKEIGKTAGVSTLVVWPSHFLVPLAFGSLTLLCLRDAWGGVAQDGTRASGQLDEEARGMEAR